MLSAIDGRTHVKDIANYLEELAIEGGYIAEFKEADSKPKYYGPKDYMNPLV